MISWQRGPPALRRGMLEETVLVCRGEDERCDSAAVSEEEFDGRVGAFWIDFSSDWERAGHEQRRYGVVIRPAGGRREYASEGVRDLQPSTDEIGSAHKRAWDLLKRP